MRVSPRASLGRLVLAASLAAAIAVGLAMPATAPGAAASPPAPAGPAVAPQATVARAVLFYSPDCAHCRELIRDGLPPILRRYGETLQILAVDASAEPGTSLFSRAVKLYRVPEAQRGVPAVVIGDRFIAGTTTITVVLPALVDSQLRSGRGRWPDLPGLAGLVSGPGVSTGASPGGLLAVTERPDGILDRLARDRWANAAALVLLAGMVAALGLVASRAVRRRPLLSTPSGPSRNRARAAASAALVAAGLGVSAYLSWAAVTGASVLCGPLAACDTVQHSSYARLLGVPVAYVGLAGFSLIGAAFLTSVLAHGRLARVAQFALLGLTFAGTAFSLYLTALEPFVLGATCLWCLSSAAVVTALLLLSSARFGLLGEGQAGAPATGVRPGGRPVVGRRARAGGAHSRAG